MAQRGRPRKVIREDNTVEELTPTARELLEERLEDLYQLRETMVAEGVDSIGKLDNLIAQVLTELKRLP